MSQIETVGTVTRVPDPTDSLSAGARVYPQCVPELVGKGVVLRAHAEADIPFIIEQSQDPQAQRFIPLPNPYEECHARGYLNEVARQGWETGKRREFAIDAVGPHGTVRFAGNIALETHGDGRFEIGFIAHPATRGQGMMTRAADRLITYAFEELDAQVILWRAFEGNLGSLRVAEKLGFTISTPLRKWAVHRRVLVDDWQGTLVRHDPRPIIGTPDNR